MLRALALASTLMIAAAAWAESPTPSTPESPGEAAAPAPAPDAKKKQTRYVNEKGETLICKSVYGGTGSRLKNRGRMICGTQAEWDDANSQLNRYVTNLTSNFRGNPGN